MLQLQGAYGRWWSLRMESIPLFQELLNAKSKLSHIQQNGIESILAIDVSQAPSFTTVYDEISDLKQAIRDVHKQMNVELASITELSDRGRNSASTQQVEGRNDSYHDIESLFLQSILKQTKNQTLLEMSIFDSLRSHVFGGEKNQDLSITFMACMEYPPYLNTDEIKLLVSLKTERIK